MQPASRAAAPVADDVLEHIERMHPHQHRAGRADVALHQRDMLRHVRGVLVDLQVEFAP